MRYVCLLVLVFSQLVGCGTVQKIDRSDRNLSSALDLVISMRSENLDVVCNGAACFASVALGGISGSSSGPVASKLGSERQLLEELNKVSASQVGEISVWVQSIIVSSAKKAGLNVVSGSREPFVAFPSPQDLLGLGKPNSAAATLHVQLWNVGFGRSAGTGFRPAVMARVYLVSRRDARIAWANAFALGPAPGGRVIQIGETTPVVDAFGDLLSQNKPLLDGLRVATDRLMQTVAKEISP